MQPILFVEEDKKVNKISSEDSEELVIEVQSTGQKISITRAESIIDALAKIGIDVPTSCQSGLCGTCKTRYISGDVEHGDCILSEAEHQEYLTPCISHVKSGTLVLDL